MVDVREFISDLQRCWQSGDLQRLTDFFHPDVVLLPPDLGEPIRGREAVVESYGEFLRAARLDRFDITGLETFSFEPAPDGGGRDRGPGHRTHMAHLEFRITYELGGERYVDTGLEVYTVVEEGERCSIVWRGQTILDSRLAEKSDPDQKA